MISERIWRGLDLLSRTMKGPTERTPVVAQVGPHTPGLTGVPIKQFLTDPDLFIKNHLMVSEYYGLDSPSFFFDLYNIEAEALGQPLIWFEKDFPEIEAKNMLIKEPEDLDALKPPIPVKSGRMPVIVEIYKRMVDLGLPVQYRFCAPFSLAGNIRGISNLIMDMVSRPEFVHKLFTFITDDVLAPYITWLREECGGNYPALGADALASLPITNLNFLNEFALGYAQRLNDHLGGIEVRGWWGERLLKDPKQLLEMKMIGHPSFLIGMDPDVDKIGPEIYRQLASKHNSPLMLGVDCALLDKGPRPLIVERVERYVKAGNKDTGLILFLNEVPGECPSEHVHAAIQAAEHFSRAETSDLPFSYRETPDFSTWAAGHKTK